MFLIREQFMDRIPTTNVDTYHSNIYHHILNLMVEIVIDYIKVQRGLNSYEMGKLEMEYRCPNEFIEIEDDDEAVRWVRKNNFLDDKGLIGYIIDNTHRMHMGRHKFILYTLKTFFDIRF